MSSSSSSFLIRTKENRIYGPFPKETILARMQSGELREMDEVCAASGYWIYLHERDESMKLLGVALARNDDFHEESTETDTETVTATAPLAAPYVAHREAGHPAASAPIHEAKAGKAATAVARASRGNRPEAIKALKFVLIVFAFLILFILARVYQVANP